MKHHLYLVACAWLVGMAALANPYRSILERNVFNLKASPAYLPPPIASNASAGVELKLTGIVQFGPVRRALVVAVDRTRVPRYFNLAQGQKEGPLEIVNINAEFDIVHGKFEGVDVFLSFPAREMDTWTAYLREEQRLGQEHGKYHELRERFDREQDERERLEFEFRKLSTPEDRND